MTSPPDTGLTRPWIPIVLGIVAGSALVALGAAGLELLGPASTLDDDAIRRLRLIGAGAAILGFGALVFQRSRARRSRTSDPDPAAHALVSAAGLMAVVAVIAWLAPSIQVDAPPPEGTGGVTAVWGDDESPEVESIPPPEEPPPPSNAPPEIVDEPATIERADPPPPETPPELDEEEPDEEEEDESEAGLFRSILALLAGAAGLLLVVLVALLGAAGLWLLFDLLRGRSRAKASGRSEDPALDDPGSIDDAGAEAGLAGSLSEVLEAEREPRGQIAAAYRLLLHHLSRAGAPRRAWEAPHEHLNRALGPLGVRPAPLHRLAELFVAAEFGRGIITGEHRAQAVKALRESLRQLRAREVRQGEPEAAPAAGMARESR